MEARRITTARLGSSRQIFYFIFNVAVLVLLLLLILSLCFGVRVRL